MFRHEFFTHRGGRILLLLSTHKEKKEEDVTFKKNMNRSLQLVVFYQFFAPRYCLDVDEDGIHDEYDDCYNPGCTIVDAYGCPRDSDGDGIPDSKAITRFFFPVPFP